MHRSRQSARPVLVWLAAVMLPVQPVPVLASCCVEATRAATAPHCCPCCGESAASSVPSKCRGGPDHSCSCPHGENQPAAASIEPARRPGPEDELLQDAAAPCTGGDRAVSSRQRAGYVSPSSIVSPAEHCVLLCKLQL